MGDATDGKAPLPYGWVVKVSKSYPDRVYYFNINSGASTWEFPDLITEYSRGISAPVSPPILSATSLHHGKPVGTPLQKTSPHEAKFSPEFSDTENSSSQASSSVQGSPVKVSKTPSKGPGPVANSGDSRRTTAAMLHTGNCGSFSVSKNLIVPLSIAENLATPSKILKSPAGRLGRPSNPGQRVRFTGEVVAQENVSPVTVSVPNMCSKAMSAMASKSSLMSHRTASTGASYTQQTTSQTTLTSSPQKRWFHKTDTSQGNKATLQTQSAGVSVSKHGDASSRLCSLTDVNSSNSVRDKPKLSRYTMEEISKYYGELSNDASRPVPHANSKGNKTSGATQGLSHTQQHGANTSLSSTSDSKGTVCKRKQSDESYRDVKRVRSDQHPVNHSSKVFSNSIAKKNSATTVHVGNRDKHTPALLKQTICNENSNNNNNTDSSRGNIKRKSSEILSRGTKVLSVTSSATSDDKRKVVKSLHSSTQLRNVTVKNEPLKKQTGKIPVGKELFVHTDVDPSDSQASKPLSKRKHFSPSCASNDDHVNNVSDDRASPTFDKPFFGDMGKLLSIQSWIDNIDERAGSDSPSQTYYNETRLGSQTDRRVVNYECGDSGTSGYSSMTRVSSPPSSFIKTERGWPGQTKPNNVASREITEMEVDDIELPESDVVCQEEEDMVIDVVLTEVREQMKTCPDKVVGVLTASVTEATTPVPDNSTADHQQLFIVIDTNVLVSELPFLEDLKDHDVEGFGKPILYIPWIVLQELDALKGTSMKPGLPINLSLSTQHKARYAVRFLKSLLSNKHPRVIGQTPKQSQEAASEFRSSCNDDTILQACLQCQKKRVGSEVVLFTNDNNLINKSLVSGVSAYNKADLMMTALPKLKYKTSPCAISPKDRVFTYEPHFSSHRHRHSFSVPTDHRVSLHPTQPVPPTSQCNTATPAGRRASCSAAQTATTATPTVKPSTAGHLATSTPLSTRQIISPTVASPPATKTSVDTPLPQPTQKPAVKYTLDQLVDDIYGKMKSVLREALGKVLETEMELVYTDIWLEIVYRKPPWSLKDILESLNKHWFAVFGLIFKRYLKQNVERLLKDFVYTSVSSITHLATASQDSLELLEQCITRDKYGKTMVHIRDCVSHLHKLCVSVKNNNKTAESIVSLDAYLQQQMPTKNLPEVKPPAATQSTRQEVHHQTGSQEVCQQTAAPAQETVDQSMLGTGILAAARLQKVWQHVYQCCDDLQNMVNNVDRSPGALSHVETLLTLLVPLLKDIRVHYNSVLQLPTDDLPNHAQLFLSLTSVCNSFFTSIHMSDDMAAVPAEDFLALFSSPEQRQPLNQFLTQLDEMIHHIYTSIHVLDPDDG